MSAEPTSIQNSELISELQRQLSKDRVLVDARSCTLFAQDVYTRAKPAMAVAQPETVAELSAVVKTAAAAGHAVIPRGGGMSYTSGYVPSETDSVVVDMQGLNQVVEINTEDMYVTVECGCTWQKLHEALKDTGFRTPFWGTLSGIHATVGGGISQNSIFWGSGKYGSAADTVIGLDVVLADGQLLRTGTNAREGSAPFSRHYGPDLTGVFTCDTGALGFKARATLKLIPAYEHHEFLSFDFDDYPKLIEAMTEISRQGLAEECFAFDPALTSVRMQRESLMSDVKKLAGVLKSAGSLTKAIKEGAKVAIAGRGFMKNVKYSLHVSIEEASAEAASDTARRASELCVAKGGEPIENSIPKILRANPFTPLNNMIGPNGERWVPVHTVVSHSKAKPVVDAVRALFAGRDEAMVKHGIGTGMLLATVANNQFVVEPVFFTPDALNEIHETYVEDHVLKKLPGFDSNPDAANLTAQLRKEVIDVFVAHGGVHMQIGKSYPYRETLRPEAWKLVQAIKNAVDPEHRVNPGSIGLK